MQHPVKGPGTTNLEFSAEGSPSEDLNPHNYQEQTKIKSVRSPLLRITLFLLGPLAAFGVCAAVLLRVLPAPLTETDYLVIGTVATFAALLALFLVMLKTTIKSKDLFVKEYQPRRRAETEETPAGDSPAEQDKSQEAPGG